MRLTTIGSVTLPQANARHNFETRPRDSLIVLPNGAFDEDGADMVFQPFQITGSMWEKETTIDSNIDALMLEMGKARMMLEATLRDDTTTRRVRAKIIDVTRDAITRTYDCYQGIGMTWRVDYPFWIHSADEPNWADTGLTADSGLTAGDGNYEEEDITTVNHTFTINNTGGVKFSKGYLWIEPQGGASIANLTVMNLTTGHEISYNASLAAAEILIIDFLNKTVRKDGTDAYANLSIGSNQRDWMQLALGNNSIEVRSVSVSGTTKLYWFWSRHFL